MDQMISRCGMRSKGSIKTGNEKGEFQSQSRGLVNGQIYTG